MPNSNATGWYLWGDIKSPESQARVDQILSTVGRPAEMDGGKRVNVYLDAQSIQTATELGDGNISAGIRIALGRI